MSDRFFLDTNIFVYSFDQSAAVKAEIAAQLIRKALSTRKGIVSYQVAGKQYVAATTGNVSRITFGNGGTPKVVIMATGLPANYQAADLMVTQPEGEASIAGPAHGRSLFAQFCAACHGMHGEGGLTSGPNIQTSRLIGNKAVLVAWIKDPKSPMPKLYPAPLSDSDVDAVAGYVMGLKAK